MKIHDLLSESDQPKPIIKKQKLGKLFRGGKQDLNYLFKVYNGVYFTNRLNTAEQYGDSAEYDLSSLGTLSILDYWASDDFMKSLMTYVYGSNKDWIDSGATAFISGNKKMIDYLRSLDIDGIFNGDMFLIINPEVKSLKPISANE